MPSGGKRSLCVQNCRSPVPSGLMNRISLPPRTYAIRPFCPARLKIEKTKTDRSVRNRQIILPRQLWCEIVVDTDGATAYIFSREKMYAFSNLNYQKPSSTTGMKTKRPARLSMPVLIFLALCLESFAEANLARDGDLIGRDAAFEEVCEFLDVLKVHEGERVFCTVNFWEPEHREALIGDEFEILPHIGNRQAGNAAAQDVFGKLHFAFDRLVDHRHNVAGQRIIKQCRFLFANRLYDLQRKTHMRRFIAEDPVRSAGKSVKQSL